MVATLSPPAIERATLLAWPALDEVVDGALVARFGRGYTKRANSIYSTDPADGSDLSRRIETLSGQYRARGLRPIVRVTPLAAPSLTTTLDQMNWDRHEQSLVLAMDLPRRMRPVPARTALFAPTDPDWLAIQSQLSGYDPDTGAVLAAILGRLAVPARGLVVYDEDGAPAGAALAVNSQGIAVFLNVVVDPDRRGRGFGRAVMLAALNWTAQSGASHAAIQVLADNSVALGLYRSLGFADQYDYHYRRAPL